MRLTGQDTNKTNVYGAQNYINQVHRTSWQYKDYRKDLGTNIFLYLTVTVL